jgi:hypothetical protein
MPERRSFEELLAESGRKTAILDSNLLVPLISTQCGADVVRNFKRAKDYPVRDIRLLASLLTHFRAVVTTSAVLAEVSNLANELTGELRIRWFMQLADFAAVREEAHIPTQSVAQQLDLVSVAIWALTACGELGDKPLECGPKLLRIKAAKQPAERVMAGRPVLQPQKTA